MTGFLFIVSLVAYLIPILLLLYMALEIYLRDQAVLNKLCFMIFFCMVLLFAGDFFTNVFPAEYAQPLLIWFKLIPALTMLPFAIHLTAKLTERFSSWPQYRIPLISYWPLLCSLFLIIPSKYVYMDFVVRGAWRYAIPSRAVILLFAVVGLYTLGACIYFLYQGTAFVRRTQGANSQKMQQIRTMELAYVVGGALCIALIYFNSFMLYFERVSFPEPSMWGLVFFAYMTRYAMTKYEFLPTIERKYKILFERSPVAILLLNREGRIMEANPAALELFSQCRSALLGLTCDQLLRPYHGRMLQQVDRERIKVTGQPVSVERVVQLERERIESGGETYEYLLLRDITGSIKAEERITYMAYCDSLTGLSNRRKFQEELAELLPLAKEGEEAGLLLLDLDRFKQVNDNRGHHVGDQLLLHVAEILRSRAEGAKMIARLGGDEFALLFTGLRSRREITLLCEEIIAGFQEPFIHEGERFYITASIGVCLTSAYGTNPDQLLQYTDIAMYEAKKKGKNGFIFFSSELKKVEDRRLSLESRMREALAEERFTLHYQPQIALSTGKVCGAEALLRWTDKDGSLISPAEFIPVAEETGLIVPLGRWVLRTACRSAKSWMDQGLTGIPVSVNVSNRELSDNDWLRGVGTILKETGLPVHLLQLEITESAIPEATYSRRISQTLLEMGVRLAIDDFGTGYSTFSSIQTMPFRTFKIDKSLIKDIAVQPSAKAVVKAMIAMGHSLEHWVVAEGVETAEQAAVLKELGCDAVQGFYFSPALPEEEWLTWSRDEGKAAAPDSIPGEEFRRIRLLGGR